jgi:hypothetical protein
MLAEGMTRFSSAGLALQAPSVGLDGVLHSVWPTLLELPPSLQLRLLLIGVKDGGCTCDNKPSTRKATSKRFSAEAEADSSLECVLE